MQIEFYYDGLLQKDMTTYFQKTELKLTNVAKESLEELLCMYRPLTEKNGPII